MFYLFYRWFHDPDTVLRFLRLFKTQQFRAMCAAITAFGLVYLAMPWFIRLMRRKGVREPSRHYSELDAGRKSAVPTMGGVVLLSVIVVSAFLWCDPRNAFVLTAVAVCVAAGLLGMADDLAKRRHGGSDAGLSRRAKYAVQIAIGLGLGLLLLSDAVSPILAPEVRERLYVPPNKLGYTLGWANVLVIAFFIVFATNAVNLTDGMDGLATVPSIFVLLVLAIFAFVIGDAALAGYLQFFPYADAGGAVTNHPLLGAGELAVLCCGAAGACAGFLWYNAFPATVMMGDTGALGLGGLMGAVAVLVRQEAVFLIAGGVFVMEIASAFLQDYIGLKLLGRRLFYRAPFHSAMLHRGVSENKVTVRLWILSGAFAVLALMTLKLR
jgi:phospho-N-acetylmuramoyl-pentapeptide-transferase